MMMWWIYLRFLSCIQRENLDGIVYPKENDGVVVQMRLLHKEIMQEEMEKIQDIENCNGKFDDVRLYGDRSFDQQGKEDLVE